MVVKKLFRKLEKNYLKLDLNLLKNMDMQLYKNRELLKEGSSKNQT